jgi:hypothetical protein
LENPRKSEDELRELRGLVERIKRGDCVLVLGPRVAIRPNDPDRRPLDDLLACEILERIEAPPGGVAISSGNLRRAADLYERQYRDPDALRDIAKDFYARDASSTTDFHRDLAELPFRLCVSASPDSLMLTAFEKAGKSPQKCHYNFRPSGGGLTPEKPLVSPTAEKPLVYHLFGHHEDPGSLVLTEGDLIRFLVAVVKGKPPLPDQVRSILADQGASFLFFGFGFQNWYLRVLLQVMDVYGHPVKAIAFEDTQFFDNPEDEQALGLLFGDRRIDFRPLRWEAFAKQLRETFKAAAPAKSEAPLLPPDAPKAFVSYASEDRETVEGLAEKLEARGIRVWQDIQDLRAGDDWKQVLLDVIANQVNYVIVVQTPTMMSRVKGNYFNDEINAALDEQKRMGWFEGQQLRFLVAVKVGSTCPLLPPLRQSHAIDVGETGGVDSLVASIKEDWARRAAMEKSPSVAQ